MKWNLRRDGSWNEIVEMVGFDWLKYSENKSNYNGGTI